MSLVLDAGALIALERGDAKMWRRFDAALRAKDTPRTHGGVVGQAWRKSGPRQALLARALESIDVRPLDAALGRAAGRLLAEARRSDVIDAAVVLLASDEDVIVTSDPDDLAPLAEAAGREIVLIVV
jgi:hypothetical protein